MERQVLIANMVGRNEASRFLAPVLERLVQQVDLIVFMDDASTDGTPQIAEAYGAKVARLQEQVFCKHEGKLRTLSWKHLEEYASVGDWVLSVDCDEMLYAPGLRKWLDQYQWHVLGITFYHMWNETHFRVDKAWAPSLSSRLFRYFPGGEFKDRKLASGAEPTYVENLIRQGQVNWNTGFRFKHLGYVRNEDKRMKYKRYSELDGGLFHSGAHIESIVDLHPTLVEWKDNG